MLETSFRKLLGNYTTDSNSIDGYWNQIHKCYTEPHRYYHTFTHLENLMKELNEVGAYIVNRHALLFTLYYHDAIYDPLRTDNEERSAILAKNIMEQLMVPDSIIQVTVNCIMATRSHAVNDDADINYFIDADLSVLGQAPAIYEAYSSDIRSEYNVYPDEIYLTGRKKLLSDFLSRRRIFKTDFFNNKYEEQARINIKTEILSFDSSGLL